MSSIMKQEVDREFNHQWKTIRGSLPLILQWVLSEMSLLHQPGLLAILMSKAPTLANTSSISLPTHDVRVATFLLFPELEFTSAFFMLSLISFLLWLIEHLLNVPCIYIFGHICCPHLNVCAQKKTTVSYSSLWSPEAHDTLYCEVLVLTTIFLKSKLQ